MLYTDTHCVMALHSYTAIQRYATLYTIQLYSAIHYTTSTALQQSTPLWCHRGVPAQPEDAQSASLVCSAHARPLAFIFSSRIIDTTAPNTNFTLDVSVAQVGCVYTLFALSWGCAMNCAFQ